MISRNQMLRKQTQNKPNHKNAKNERNFCYTKELQRNAAIHPPKKQTQNKPKCSAVGGFPLDSGGRYAFLKTATTFSTSTTKRRLSPSKSTGMAPLGLKRTLSYCFNGNSSEISTSAETETIRPVMVGISILSGSWIPPFVCFLSSSLRITTRLPIGSTVSRERVFVLGFFGILTTRNFFYITLRCPAIWPIVNFRKRFLFFLLHSSSVLAFGGALLPFFALPKLLIGRRLTYYAIMPPKSSLFLGENS